MQSKSCILLISFLGKEDILTENIIMIPSSSSSAWDDCMSAMSPLPREMFRTPGNDASTIHAAEQRLNIQFPDDVKAMMQYCSGANLPLQTDDWRFHPVACLWSVEYWQDVEDSDYKETFDAIIEDKEKYRRFIIGNDPFGADYGKVVLLRLPRIPSSQHSAASVELCTLSFPEFIEFESLESWIRSSRTLTFDEYIQEWNGYLLDWRVLDDDTLEQQEKQTKIMSFANEQVRFYCQATGDTCAEAAWTRHSKEWEATVVPAIFNASLSNTEDSSA
jgi:hypothetical protein